MSKEGLQQGDPQLGPAQFCTKLQPLRMSLTSEFKGGFMDDLTLGGPEAQVARDVETVRREREELGLRFNEIKCEFISNTSQSTEYRDNLHELHSLVVSKTVYLVDARLCVVLSYRW